MYRISRNKLRMIKQKLQAQPMIKQGRFLIHNQFLKTPVTYDQKHILGSIIQGNALNEALKLVEIKGLFYRYQFINQAPIVAKRYQVIAVIGNQVTLKIID